MLTNVNGDYLFHPELRKAGSILGNSHRNFFNPK